MRKRVVCIAKRWYAKKGGMRKRVVCEKGGMYCKKGGMPVRKGGMRVKYFGKRCYAGKFSIKRVVCG